MLELTLKELEVVHREQLDKLVGDAGSGLHLAKMLNINSMVVKGWTDRGRISKQGAKLVESHPTLGEHHKAIALRPDLEV